MSTLGVVAAVTLAAALSVALPAAAAPQGAGDRLAQIGADEQAGYEAQLDAFLSSNPEPTAVDADASVAEQNAYWDAMAAWWDSVPWEAVAGQWGCELGTQSVVIKAPDKSGVASAGHGGVIHCGDVELSDQELSAVGVAATRSSQAAHRGILATSCSPSGQSYRHCLSTAGTTLTATFQYFGSGNITGASRGGLVGVGNPCAQGSLVSQGPVGIGTYGSVWSTSGSINQNSQYSASFIVGGTGIYSRYCAIV